MSRPVRHQSDVLPIIYILGVVSNSNSGTFFIACMSEMYIIDPTFQQPLMLRLRHCCIQRLQLI